SAQHIGERSGGTVHVAARSNSSVLLTGYSVKRPPDGTSVRWSRLRPFFISFVVIHTLGTPDVTYDDYYRYRIQYLKENGSIVLLNAEVDDSGVYETILTSANSTTDKTYFNTILAIQDVLQMPVIVQDRGVASTIVHFNCVVRLGEVNEILWMKGDTILSGDSIYQISIDNKTLRIDAPQLPNCELITCVVRNKVSENRNSRLLRISGLLSLHEFSLISSAIALVSSVTSYGAEAFIILYALDAYKIHKRHVELTAVFVFFQMISCLTLLTASVFCVIDPSYPLAYRIISGAAILFITAKIIYVLALYLQHESELKRSFLVKQRRRNIFLLCGTFRIIISIIPIYRGLYN
ncbi:hepatic and glial cell adhesion molecule-like, partial [Scyliorhinus torazame]|uniref:hepatic and glial cell adhesion molecule-like n=1 Tax=Scyliorhinus torazame TaxID=75743 RepID=UPI003B595158